MFEFNYSVGDIKNSDLGEEIVCFGEGSGVKGGGKWGMPTPLSTPSFQMGGKMAKNNNKKQILFRDGKIAKKI